MASARTCETCGLEVPPGLGTCPRDGTAIAASYAAHDDEVTQIGTPSNVWGEEPPARGGKASPFAWGEEPAPRGHSPSSSPEVTVAISPWGEEPPTRDALIGMKLGEYELRQRIGVGGMGFVYDGIQPLIGKRVAVKVLRPELAQAPEQVARLLAEARAVNAIRHRGIIDIFGFGQVPDGRQYIVMEFLDGQPLDAHLAEKGRLAPTEALSILDEVLAALGAAHGAGVVHRDLKPSNIFLVREPGNSRYVKLLDFGLAKQGQGPTARTAQTRTDMVVGTPEYMAPEQARGQAVGPMTDLYAMGVVTFEMVTGRLPFTGSSPVDLLMKHVDARPPRPSEFVPELPPALDAFILQMLTKDPEARPGSADALRQQLHRLRRTLLRPTRAQVAPTSAVPPARALGQVAAPELPAPVPLPVAPPPPPAPLTKQEAPTAPNETVKVPESSARAHRPTPTLPHPSTLTAEEARAAGLRPALRPRTVAVAVGIVALLAAGGLLLLRGEDAPPEPLPGPGPRTPVTPPPVEQAPAVPQAPTPPAPLETAPVPSPQAPVPAEPLKDKPADRAEAPKAAPPVRTKPSASAQQEFIPSQQELTQNLDMIERDLNSRAAAGQDMDFARSQLTRLRDMSKQSAGKPEVRREVSRGIEFLEKNLLKRK
ncbi:serine/threonine-protein kinase [Stigmatella erecta]|uniref:non-specific serine/threonine protein kinase n=1 Tax=Stigmatella erecta TaxID=83460 RepID=A0A1I0LFL6_9BACT|nr:serine/threonine-protein kinase [Stigmatella erecta]SEU38899.1 serine/threonine protein kinase [Stigmatella erecta]